MHSLLTFWTKVENRRCDAKGEACCFIPPHCINPLSPLCSNGKIHSTPPKKSHGAVSFSNHHPIFSFRYYLSELFGIFNHVIVEKRNVRQQDHDGKFPVGWGVWGWRSVGGFSCFVLFFFPLTQVRILRPRLSWLIRIYSENEIFFLT